jgi:predicted GNAT superfamily acetyltransferase
MMNPGKPGWILRIIESPDEMVAVEQLQRQVWPGSETDIVPLHLLITMAHNGGLVIGAYINPAEEEHHQAFPPSLGASSQLVGFVFGFPGLYQTPDGPRPKHCSHQLGVHPDYRNQGLGFALKRAQWQMVRHQGLDLITWTYDPLLSRNAYLNIARLGAVCSTYKQNIYGDMRDELNEGLPSDRFQVDWWVNTQRVQLRLSRRPRRPLDLAHFLSAGARIINPTQVGENQLPRPIPITPEQIEDATQGKNEKSLPLIEAPTGGEQDRNLILVEIPSDFMTIRVADPGLALEWRLHSRQIFEDLLTRGYLITDFVYLPGIQSRSFYLLSHGESTL